MAVYASSCVLAHALADVKFTTSGGLGGVYLGLNSHPFDRNVLLPEYFTSNNTRAFEDKLESFDSDMRLKMWLMPSGERHRPTFKVPLFVGQIVNINQNATGVIVGQSVTDKLSDKEALQGINVTFGIFLWKFGLHQGFRPISFNTKALVPVQITRASLRALYADNPFLGYYFSDAESFPGMACKRADDERRLGKVRFILNDTFRKFYPDDDAFGAAWVRS